MIRDAGESKEMIDNKKLLKAKRIENESGYRHSPESICYPTEEGNYLLDGEPVEVYPLEPADGILCVWCDDVGMKGMTHTEVWINEKWFGHIPVSVIPGCQWPK